MIEADDLGMRSAEKLDNKAVPAEKEWGSQSEEKVIKPCDAGYMYHINQ